MYRTHARFFLISMVCLAQLAALSGCGSTGFSSSTEADRSERNAHFKITKADEKFVKFGEEAPDQERETASAVLEENLQARQSGDFGTQCATLDAKTVAEVAGSGVKDPAGACPKALRKLADPLSSTKSVRRNTLGAPIAALRVKADKAYALYHGNDENDYAMPMEKEGADWKVDSLLTTQLSVPHHSRSH